MRIAYVVIALVLFSASVFAKPKWYRVAYTIPYQPEVMHFGLTPQEAEQRLLRWMNTPGLTLRLVGVACSHRSALENRDWWPVYDPHWAPGGGLSYLFEDNTGKLYLVAIVPIELWEYLDPDAEPTEQDYLSPTLSGEERNAIARQFVASRVPNLVAEDHENYRSGVLRALHNGLPHNRVAIVDVHPTHGVVYECFWRNPGVPAGLDTTPHISLQQAQQIAESYLLHLEEVVSVDVYNTEWLLGVLSDVMGTTRLAWEARVEIVGVTEPGSEPWKMLFDVSVDAHTGEIVHLDEYLSRAPVDKPNAVRSSKRTFRCPRFRVLRMRIDSTDVTLFNPPPVQVNKTAYLWVGWLRLPLFATKPAEVTYNPDKTVTITLNGQRWTVRAGSSVLTSGKSTIRLSAPAINLFGRVYLPVDAFKPFTRYKMEADDYTLNLHR